MIRAHTVAQVRAAEAAKLAQVPEGALMQRAAHGLAYAVLDYLGTAYGKRVLLLVGPGDNGGDALFAGAVLARRGVRVEAWQLSERIHEAGAHALRRVGGRVVGPSPTSRSLSGTRPDLVVDGILGIGGRPGLSQDLVTALEQVRGIPIVAVDVPSGVNVDTGEVDGPHVHADLTVTFGTHKSAHLIDPAASACGKLHLIDLDLDLPTPALEALRPHDVAKLLPRPASDAHKYTRGVVGIRAGSATYPGAALLSVAGANTGLCGMVRYVGDEAVADRVRQANPEVVGDGRVQAWVVGSGSGTDAEAQLAEARADAEENGVPLLIDADALIAVPRPWGIPSVLTPHAGELAAMMSLDRAEIEAAPLAHARRAAQEYDATVLLKGRHTLIAAPDGRTRVTTTGTAWLASAGAGDVLGGLIGSLLAAGLTPFDAASVGSWLHGTAARIASVGGPMTASAVAQALPEAVRALPSGG